MRLFRGYFSGSCSFRRGERDRERERQRRLAVAKIIAYVQQERYRQHRMVNHSYCFYRRAGHHQRRQVVLPDPIDINRQSARLRAYGVDLRTSVTGRRPPARRLPPPAACGGAGVAAGAEASRRVRLRRPRGSRLITTTGSRRLRRFFIILHFLMGDRHRNLSTF